MSPVVGIILMLAIEITAGVVYFNEKSEWNGSPAFGWDEDEYTVQEARKKCRCEPVLNDDGSMCEPISLPDRYGVAWKCDLKPKLMYPTHSIPSA